MSDQWYYERGGQPRGPLSPREFKELVQSGDLKSATLVWREGLADWVTAGSLGLLEKSSPPKPPPLPRSASNAAPPPPPPPRQSYSSPPRPLARPTPQSSRVIPILAAIGVALLAGSALGWLGHAMLASSVPKDLTSTPNPRIEQPAKPRTRTSEPARSVPGAATIQPVRPTAAPSPVGPSATVSASPSLTLPSPEPPKSETPAAFPPLSTSATAVPAAAPATPAAVPKSPASSPSSNSSASTQSAQTLFQEIDVQRAPKYSLLGIVSAQELHYQLLSELSVGQPDQSGIRTVGQIVKETRLVKADELSRPAFDSKLKEIKGWQFSYTLTKDGEVLKMMAGPADAPKVAKVEPKGGKGFLVSSVMDEAGWKELAQLSFYVPDEQASGNKRQVRQMTHDFGPLGSWSGETTFQRQGTQNGILRIDYSHKLKYLPPADGAVGDLPFAIKGANFKPDIAGGTILFDTKTKRVQAAQDRFLVKGEVATDVATVQLEEEQAIEVRIHDRNPWSH